MNVKYIRLASDLHMEGFVGKHFDYFVPPHERDATSVLCLAGDISSSIPQLANAVWAACKRFPHVLFVPGNHEYYGHVYQTWRDEFLEDLGKLPDNFYTSFGDIAGRDIAGVRFLMCTLWADCADKLAVGTGINDFRLIKMCDGSNFTPDIMVAEHQRHRRLLKFVLEADDGVKTVVMTHHLPSYRLIEPQYAESRINGGFASHSDDLFARPTRARVVAVRAHARDHRHAARLDSVR